MRKLAIVAGAALLYPAVCSAQTFSQSCIGARCAVYENNRRVGSYENRGYGRVTVRDAEGRRLATVENRGHGRYRVTPTRKRR